MDPGLNSLLRWSTEQTARANANANGSGNGSNQTPPSAPRGAASEALRSLFQDTPSDADMLIGAMGAIKHDEVSLEDKVIAFDNFEQLVENVDNANNLESLKLWQPLIEKLADEEAEMRKMAAWCIGTAVQNNADAQSKLFDYNVIPTLAAAAQNDTDPVVRKKSVYALSSAVRNYQPSMDILVQHLPEAIRGTRTTIDSSDMEVIDDVMQKLRDQIQS